MVKRIGLRTASVVAALLYGCGALNAATLIVDSGEVRIRKEKGFRIVKGAAQTQPGEQIMVSANAKARIVYGNGCVTQLSPGLSRVTEEKLCDPATTGANLDSGLSLKDTPPPPPPYEGGLDSTKLMLIGMAVAFGAGAAIRNDNGDNNTVIIIQPCCPVSP